MNSTGRLSNKGSTDAADYAQKRKMQMERAKQLREERKNGGVGNSASSNVFKSVAQDFIRQGSTNSRSNQQTQMSNMNGQDSTATSMLSSPSIQGGRFTQDPFMNSQDRSMHDPQQQTHQRQNQYSQMAYNQQMQNSNNGFQNNSGGFQQHPPHQQLYQGDNHMPQQDAFQTPLNGGVGQQNFGGPPPRHQMNQNLASHNMGSDGFMRNSNSNFGGPSREGVIVNGMQRNRSVVNNQYNQFNASTNMLSPGSNHGGQQLPPRQQNFGGPPSHMYPTQSPTPTGMQTIQHDMMQGGPAYRQQTQIGFSQQNLQTQEFGDMRQGGMTQYPGNMTPNRQTHYSQRDIEEARGSLTLLKKRMSNSRDRQPKTSTTIDYSSTNQPRGQGYDTMQRQQNNGGIDSRSQRNTSYQNTQNGANSNVPPKPPRVNQSQIYDNNNGSLNETPGQSGNNYRKVFKPNIAPSRQTQQDNEHDSNDSVDRANALALGNTPTPTQQRKAAYQPERKQTQSNRGIQNYQRDLIPGSNQQAAQENHVLQSSPAKRSRAGLPPTTNRMKNVRNSTQMNAEQPPQQNYNDPYEDMGYNKPSGYNLDEAESDPFGSKKAAVMNTPPKSNPMGMGGGHQIQNPSSNFHDELGGQSSQVQQPEAGSALMQCSTCERKFNAKALERHSKICVKVFQTKRKAFDVAEMRKATDANGKGAEEIKSSGASSYKPTLKGRGRGAPRGGASQPEANSGAAPKKIPKWKLQSMQFRQAVGPIDGPSSGGGGASNFNPTQEASIDMDDRVQCEFCGRKFAEKTAERHIPHCETKYKANLMKNGPPPRAGGAKKRAPSYGMRR